MDYELKQKRFDEDYDVLVNITTLLEKARKAGWRIDIIAEHKSSKKLDF